MNYLAPEIRPGWTYLASNDKPNWLIDAEENHRDRIESVDTLVDMLDEVEDENARADIHIVLAFARKLETDAENRVIELRKVWQANCHPELSNITN